MAEETKKPEENLSDEEIAELANAEIRKKNEEIAKLKKDLAKAKLYSEAPEGSEELLSSEEYRKALSDNTNTNYDVAYNAVKLCEAFKEEGNTNPYDTVFKLGEESEDVYTFLKNAVDACDGDKSQFVSIYQSMLAPDDPKIAAAYRKAQKNK